jgi:hypothetical protein
MANDGLRRFIGGSPIGVFIRLAALSILIGFVLTVLGLDPRNILYSIETLIRWVFTLGFDAIESLWRYLLLGAVVVIPIWLIMRLVQSRKS